MLSKDEIKNLFKKFLDEKIAAAEIPEDGDVVKDPEGFTYQAIWSQSEEIVCEDFLLYLEDVAVEVDDEETCLKWIQTYYMEEFLGNGIVVEAGGEYCCLRSLVHWEVFQIKKK